MGEYKEAMEVLKRALKLEPANKVRLCGWAGQSPRHLSYKSTCEHHPSPTEERSLEKQLAISMTATESTNQHKWMLADAIIKYDVVKDLTDCYGNYFDELIDTK